MCVPHKDIDENSGPLLVGGMGIFAGSTFGALRNPRNVETNLDAARPEACATFSSSIARRSPA
jgi:hypothetical protein